MNYCKTITVLFCFCIDVVFGFSQTSTYIFQSINNPVLSQYNLRHICADAYGKIWLSTDNGLLCYDGNDVKNFQHNADNPSSISSNNISKIYPDKKGNLYIINDFGEKNLSFMNGKTGKFSVVNIQHTGEDYRLMATPFAYADLLIDDDSSLWIACYNIGFVHCNQTQNPTETFYLNKPYSGSNTVYTIKKDTYNKNLLWLGTENGIYSFNKKTKKLNRNFRCINAADFSVADLQVTNIDVYNADTIWFSVHGKGIGCYDIKTGFYKIYPVSTKKVADENSDLGEIEMQRKSRYEYFVSTKYSLPGIFNTYTKQYIFASATSQALPAIQLNYFLADGSGNLWCLLYNRLFYAPSINNKFKTERADSNVTYKTSENPFKKIVWDEKRKTYFVAFEKSKAIFVLDPDFKLIKSIPIVNNNKLTTNEIDISDIVLDAEDRLWICGNLLYVYNEAKNKIEPSNSLNSRLSFPNQFFQNIVVRGNDMFLQPSDFFCRAIYHINTGTFALDSIMLPDEISKDKNYVTQPVKLLNYLAMDKKGENAYIGCSKYSFEGYTDCLIQYNIHTKQVKKIIRVEGMAHSKTSNLFNYALDDSDRIWVDTEDGIFVFSPATLKTINKIEIEAPEFAKRLQNLSGTGLMCRLYSNGITLYDYKNNNEVKLGLSDGLISLTNSAVTFADKKLFVGASNYIQYLPINSIKKAEVSRHCYLSALQLFNHPYQTDTLPEFLHAINLSYNKNFITLSFSSKEFEQSERLEYRYKLDGVDKSWINAIYLNRTVSYNNLKPGKYTFHAAVKNDDGKWSADAAYLLITIIPAWWQTDLFKIAIALLCGFLIYILVLWRIKTIRKQEQVKSKYEKELLELEAKALRAQMNPHFIFNCMNSIKSLIQKNEQEKSILYLTTFSKLIRTVFQNSDKREVSMFDEIETCRLYIQLESMRFGNKFSYQFNIDGTLDLKSIMVPALVIQPFIENAIWHGIMPKEQEGTVTVTVNKTNNIIQCIIDDNGIGREISKQNKFLSEEFMHESKGEYLTLARIDLDNLLNERNAKIEIIDKKNEDNQSTGTTVILSFSEY